MVLLRVVTTRVCRTTRAEIVYQSLRTGSPWFVSFSSIPKQWPRLRRCFTFITQRWATFDITKLYRDSYLRGKFVDTDRVRYSSTCLLPPVCISENVRLTLKRLIAPFIWYLSFCFFLFLFLLHSPCLALFNMCETFVCPFNISRWIFIRARSHRFQAISKVLGR